MTIKTYSVLIVVCCLFCVNQLHSQVVLKGVNSENMFDIPEVGALVLETKDGMKVEAVIPMQNRPKEYQNADIQKGDKIMMINGKRIRKAKECREIYNNLPVNGEFKLGLSRQDKMIIITIKKADPKTLPVAKRVIIKSDGKGEKLKEGEGNIIIRKK